MSSSKTTSPSSGKRTGSAGGGGGITMPQVNPHWAKLPLFDRKGWKTVRFGDVVENLNDSCEPGEARLDRFIGLEHLEPGSLHIRTWGNVADGTTFNRRCRPGQLLFGKRRAYQRKVAVADFDAVVSGDIYVLAPKGDRLLSELLPFVCLSERFFQHAVGTSAGSLSPRTNWTSLSSFEFALPPLDQQRRIAEILWAVDEVTQRHQVTSQQIEQLPLSFANHVTGAVEGRRGATQTAALGEVADVIDCKHRTPKPCVEGVPIVSPGNIKWGALDLSGCRLTSEEQHQDLMDHCVVREWDMVMGRNQTFGIAAFVQQGQRFVLGQDTVLIQSRKLSSKYVYLALQSSLLRSQIDQLSIGSTFKRINLKDIRALRIPLANASMQREAENRVDQYEKLKLDVQRNGEAVSNLRSSILNVVMNGSRQSV